MRLTSEEFEKIQFIRDAVVSLSTLVANEIRLNNGNSILLALTDGKNSQATRYGTLVKMPRDTKIEFGEMFTCALDCEAGDDVWWDSFFTQQAIAKEGGDKDTQDHLIEVDDEIYLRVPSVALVAAKRGDEHISLNGYIVAEPIDESEIITDSGIWVPREKKNTTRARVVAKPKSMPVYRSPDKFRNTEVEIGDIVTVENHFALPLDKTYRSETNLVRILSCTVLAIE